MKIKAFLNFLKSEPRLGSMFAVVLLFFGLSFFANTPFSSEESPVASTESRQATTSEMKQLSHEMMNQIKQNPMEGIGLGGLFLLLLVTGVALNVWVFLSPSLRRLPGKVFATAPAVPWGGRDVFRALVILFFSEIVILSLGAFLSGFIGLSQEGKNGVLMTSTLIRNMVVTFYIALLIRNRYAAPIAALGWSPKKILFDGCFGLLAYAAFLPYFVGLMIGVSAVIQSLGIQPPAQVVIDVFYREKNPAVLILFSVFIALVGPLFEEILFRGFIYQAFRKKWGVLQGMTATSLLFAVMHAHWVGFIPIFALSMMITVVYEKTRSVIASTSIHATHNLLTLLLMLQIKTFSVSG